MENPITSNRLLLRPRSLQDIDACIAMDCDPVVTQYIEGPWHDPELHRTFLTERMSESYAYPLGYWAITFIENPELFLGWVMVLPLDISCSRIEIGWRLTRETWGQGVATEATKRIVNLIGENMPRAEIVASIHPENQGSLKVARKIGMSFDYEKHIDGVAEQFFIMRCA